MRAALAAAAVVLAVLARAARAQDDVPPERRAFVEVDAGRESFYVGEEVLLVVRVGVDSAWFESHVAPMRAGIDVPVHVVLRLEGAAAGEARVTFARETVAGPARTFALDDDAADARVVAPRRVGDRTFEVVEARLRGIARRPGPLAVPAPVLEFSHGDRVVEASLGFRVVENPVVAVVRGAPLALRVVALPAEGRPPGASDSVGRFALRARASRAEVGVGQPFRLTLTVTGEGRPAPDFAGWRPEGFHVFGVSPRATAPGEATTDVELSAERPDVTAVPPAAFSFFDPAPGGGWRTVESDPVPLRVTAGLRPARDGTEWRSVDDDVAAPPHPLRVVLLALAEAALAVAGVLVARGRRRRAVARGAGTGPRADVALPAAEAFRRRVARGESVADAFAGALAAAAGCTPAAVVGPDLAERLRRAGARPDAAERAARVLEALVARRYRGGDGDGGGGGEGDGDVDAATVAAILEDLRPAGATGRGVTPA